MTDLISREDALDAAPRCGFCDWHEAIRALPAAQVLVPVMPPHEYCPSMNPDDCGDCIYCGNSRLAHDDPALPPTSVDASQTPDPVIKDPRVKALVAAVSRFEKLMQTQMRTADYHSNGCKCIRCAEDEMFAALREIGGDA